MDPFSEPSPEKKKYALIAAAIFLLQAASSVLFLTRSNAYVAFDYDRVIDGALLVIWLGAAIAMLVRRPWMAYVAALGVFSTLAHGLVAGVSMGWPALPYVVSAIVLMVCWGKSFALFRPAAGPARRSPEAV